MVEEIDNDFFQQDFTTASEWEIFNARLEEIFHEWKLPFAEVKASMKSNQLFICDWEIKTQAIYFANVELSVKFYKAKVVETDEGEIKQTENNQYTTEKFKKTQTHLDLMDLRNNFCISDIKKSQIHPLAVWFGLREFVVIEPVKHSIINESQCRTLLSSACISSAESCTEIPTFISIMQQDLNVYFGVGISSGMRINFDVIVLETAPSVCKYLSGLLCMFKEKIGLTYIKPVTVSIRMTYAVSDFSKNFHVKGKIPFSINSDEEDEDKEQFVESFTSSLNFYALPYGVSMDPLNELFLNCIWPEVTENVVVDSAIYSDLHSMLAPVWSIRVDFKLQPIYYLTDTTSEYLKLLENSQSFVSIVSTNYELDRTQNVCGRNSLDLLTKSKISNFASTLTVWKESPNEKKSLKINKSEGPIKDKELMQMLYYMFPDAEKDSTHPYEYFENSNLDSSQIKTGGPNSLVHRLSMLLATCNSYFGGIQGIGQLWSEFTQEMRYRVENCIQIPGRTEVTQVCVISSTRTEVNENLIASFNFTQVNFTSLWSQLYKRI